MKVGESTKVLIRLALFNTRVLRNYNDLKVYFIQCPRLEQLYLNELTEVMNVVTGVDFSIDEILYETR